MIPALLQKYFQVPFQFGGTGLMIVVGVALDTVQQIESHLITRNYEGFTGPRGPRIRGRGSRVSGAIGSCFLGCNLLLFGLPLDGKGAPPRPVSVAFPL